MKPSKLSLVSPRQPPATLAPPPAPSSSALAPLLAGIALVLVAVAAAFTAQRQLETLLSDLDGQSLEQAAQLFDHSVEQQRRSVLSEVTVLADDTRVRATAMSTNFDEATMRDVLDDLKKTSGASLLAVLDVTGKVRAVTGAQGLRDVDLSTSAVIKSAAQKAGADVWTISDHVLLVGVAPVRTGQDVAALFLMGFEVGENVLAAIRKTLGVDGAVLVRDRIAATSSTDPDVQQGFRTASAFEIDRNQVVRGPRDFTARVTRTSASAAAGKIVWLVPHQHHAKGARNLILINWIPVFLVVISVTFVFLLVRRRPGRAV